VDGEEKICGKWVQTLISPRKQSVGYYSVVSLTRTLAQSQLLTGGINPAILFNLKISRN
jgi:hypothetical protein